VTFSAQQALGGGGSSNDASGESKDGTHETAGKRVLLADDNHDAALSLAILLRHAGYHVRVVHDGSEAWEEARSFRPHAAILDIGMPGLTGIAVCQAIRAESWGDKALLIALTGWGQPKDRQRTFAAGFDHHLTKPVDPLEIEGLLASARFDW
jgi:CheY-like chemotaxis protein